MKKFILRLPFLYAFISIFLLAISGSIGLLSPDFSVVYTLLFFIFFAYGVIHLFLFYKWLPSLSGSFWKEVGYTFFITFVSALLVIITYLQIENDITKGIAAASALIAFTFPIIVVWVYHSYSRIPTKDFKKWHYPVGKQLPDMDLLDLSRVLVIQFEFTKNGSEKSFTNFRAKAPVSMLFGELFFIFINDYNDRNAENSIQYLDETGQPQSWLFYKKEPWYKRRFFIDPDLTFQANGITDNETIVAVRA